MYTYLLLAGQQSGLLPKRGEPLTNAALALNSLLQQIWTAKCTEAEPIATAIFFFLKKKTLIRKETDKDSDY